MLILPILLLWAPAPMRFSKRLLRSATLSVIAVALFTPLLSVTPLAAADHFQESNPFRSTEAEAGQTATEDLRCLDRKIPRVSLAAPAANTIFPGTIVPRTEGHFITDGKRVVLMLSESKTNPRLIG